VVRRPRPPGGAGPEAVRSKFLQLGPDAATQAFLDECRREWHPARDAFAMYLRKFMCITDANGWACRGQMHALTAEHIEKLCGGRLTGRLLLDIGAGDGSVTKVVAPGFERVVCTEVSSPMIRRLRQQGWEAPDSADLNNPDLGAACYDCILLSNILDRIDAPHDLLTSCCKLLRPGGTILVALVLPWCPFVEDGTSKRPPKQPLPMTGGFCCQGAGFEASLEVLAEKVLEPLGLHLQQWAKVPYLCRGDSNKAWYVLSDAVMVLKSSADAPEVVERREPARMPSGGVFSAVLCPQRKRVGLL